MNFYRQTTYTALAIFTVIFISSCEPDKPKDTIIPDKPIVQKPRVIPPEFNSDTAFSFIKAQADMGPRTPGSKAHDLALNYYEKQFKKYGAEVIIQKGNVITYDNKPWLLKNVIASYNPKAQTRILLSAHWDSRPFADKDKEKENRSKPCPGVNDGASGVGILMELARLFSQKQLNVGIDIILFDLEDYGDNGDMDSWCLGSQYWSKNLHTPFYGAKFGVLLDMVGAKNATFPKEGLSRLYAGEYVNKIWATAQNLGYGNYFINQDGAEMTDDHAPINKLAQIPCVDILHYNIQENEFFEYHHTTQDDIKQIDKNTLKVVGQTLLEVIYNE